MNTELEELGGMKYRVSFEIDADTLESRKRKIARGYAPFVKMKGFRPGKVPLELVMRQLGPELDKEALEAIIQESLDEAVEKNELKLSSKPKVDLEDDDGKPPYRCRIEFECLPTVDPTDYLGVEIEDPTLPEITDEDVDAGLARLQEAAARFEPRPEGSVAHEQDVAVCRITAVDKETGEEVRVEPERRLVVGIADYPVEGTGRELLGLKVGETATVEGPYENLEGEQKELRTAVYTLEVTEILEKKLPELDDEFAKRFGGGDTLAEWRDKVRRELEERRQRTLKEMREDAVMDAVIAKNPVELGESTVANLADAAERATKERLLPMLTEEDREKVDLGIPREETEAGAKRQLSRRILLGAIADKEGVEVTEEEYEAKLKEMADETGIPLPKIRARLEGEAGDDIRTRLRQEKTLDMLVRYAVVKPAGEAGGQAGDGGEQVDGVEASVDSEPVAGEDKDSDGGEEA